MTQPGRATINGIAGLGRRLPFIYDKKVVLVKPAACSASIPATGGTVTASLASSDAGCPPPIPTLKVVCTSSIGEGVVVRGETITCSASVTPKQPFTITGRASEGADGYRYKTDEPIESSGEPVDWAGRAVVDTRATMNGTVTVKGAKVPLAPASAQFTVRARTGSEWIKLTVPETPPQETYVNGYPLDADPFPKKDAGSLETPDGALGKYKWELNYLMIAVLTGPNTNLYYEKVPASLLDPVIYVHSWLLPNSDFSRRQRGNANIVMGERWCTRSNIEDIRRRVIDHERAHHALNVEYFASHDVQQAIERMHFYTSDASDAFSPAAKKEREAASQRALGAAYEDQLNAMQAYKVDRLQKVTVQSCKVQ